MESLELVVVVAMIGVNSVFAAYEIALASISLARLQALDNQGARGARAALDMKRGIEESLAVVQLGITLVGLVAGAAGGASATDDVAPLLVARGIPLALANVLAIALIVVPLTALTIVLGELVPKLFALRNKEWVCLRLSPPMRWFSRSVWPLVWLLESSASGLMTWSEKIWKPASTTDHRAEAIEIQELRAIAGLARTSRLIGSREENIILGAARLAGRPVEEILIPADSIRMLCVDQPLADALIAAHHDMHTRFPVAERANDPQTICGYVTFKDIVAALRVSPGDPSIRGVLREITSIQAGMTIAVALEHLLRGHAHIALVRSAGGQIVGMVTLEDIVEELLGDIHDEYDLLPTHVVRSGTGWVVGGGATLAKVQESTGIALPDSPATHNLNGWIIAHLGRSPQGGEEFRIGSHRLLIRKIRRNQALEVLLGEPAGNATSAPAPDQSTQTRDGG